MQNTKKCVFLCLLSNKSAIGDSFVDLINNLDEETKKCIVVVKNSVYVDELFDVDKTSIFNLSINRSNINLRTLFKLISTLKSISTIFFIENVFVYGMSPLNHFASLIIKSKKRLFWVHDADVHSGAHVSEWTTNTLLRIFGFFGVASRFVVSNNYLKKRVVTRFSVPPDMVSVVNFPFISAIVHSGVCGDPIEKNIDLLFFGRVEPYKGVNILLEAISALKNEDIFFKTVIAGKGNKIDIPLDLNVIRINSYIENSCLRSLIAESRLCVFPYTSATGTQAIQTALAIGTKCLVSNLPAFVEIAEQANYKGITVFETENDLVNDIKYVLGSNCFDNATISDNALCVFSENKFGYEVSRLVD